MGLIKRDDLELINEKLYKLVSPLNPLTTCSKQCHFGKPDCKIPMGVAKEIFSRCGLKLNKKDFTYLVFLPLAKLKERRF